MTDDLRTVCVHYHNLNSQDRGTMNNMEYHKIWREIKVSVPVGKYHIAFVAFRNHLSQFTNAYMYIDDISMAEGGCVGKEYFK